MYDLLIRTKSTKEKESKLLTKRMYELGWDCIAWNTAINGKATGNQIKPISIVPLDLAQLRDASWLRSLATSSTATGLRQINRLTVTVDDIADAQSLHISNPVLGLFDMVAARPGNAKVFAHLCKQSDIDVITLDFTHRLPFALNKKLLDEAVKRGIHFEITYSAILNSAAGGRKELFANTKVLIQYLRGRHVILSSNADSWMTVRGPMDVCNLGVLLGFKQEQALQCVSDNCVRVLQHGAARRRRYLPLEVVSMEDFRKMYPEIGMLGNQYPHGSSSSSGGEGGDDVEAGDEEHVVGGADDDEEEEEEDNEEEEEEDDEEEEDSMVVGTKRRRKVDDEEEEDEEEEGEEGRKATRQIEQQEDETGLRSSDFISFGTMSESRTSSSSSNTEQRISNGGSNKSASNAMFKLSKKKAV